MEAKEFEAIYSKYEGLVRATLRHYGVRPADLDDLVQDAFVTIHRKLPEFEGRSSMETWIHSVCWRIAVNHRRLAHVRRETALTAEGPGDPPPLEVEGAQAARLHAMMEGLPEKQRDQWTLAEVGGLSISALARLTHTTRRTARDGVKRARLALERSVEAPATKDDPTSDNAAASSPHRAGVLTETHDSTDYIDDGCCICTIGRNTFVVLRGCADVPRHRILTEAMRRSKERHGHGLTYLCIVEPTSTPPDRATRKMNAEILTMLGDSVCAYVFAIEGELEGILVPAVMNAAAFISRSPIPRRYFRDLARAAEWLAPYCEGETATSLIAQMEGMRKRLDERTCGGRKPEW